MKKNLFTMAVLFGYATVSIAQTSFIATLQHEDEFSHYYGAGALTSAYNAAESGDIITLSPGTFTSPGIMEKSITVRGAGVGEAEITCISNNVTFYSEDSTYVTTVEGIYFKNSTDVSNRNTNEKGKGTIKFIKCNFNYLNANTADWPNSYKGPAVRIYNGRIYNMYFSGYTNPDFLFYNSYVIDPHSSNNNFSETTTAFVNCVIEWTSSYASSAYYLNFYNCIFNWTWGSYAGSNTSYTLPNTVTCYNCLSINKSPLFSYLVSGGNNWTIDSAANVFGEGKYGDTFELTDAAKESYIGTDGTQIGMQGGNYPYTTTVQYPVITKFNADPQTNKEGMLNVEVEVDGK